MGYEFASAQGRAQSHQKRQGISTPVMGRFWGMKPLKILFYLAGATITILLIAGFFSTFYQVITGHIICCRGDKEQLATPITIYSLLVPICLVVFILKRLWRKK